MSSKPSNEVPVLKRVMNQFGEYLYAPGMFLMVASITWMQAEQKIENNNNKKDIAALKENVLLLNANVYSIDKRVLDIERPPIPPTKKHVAREMAVIPNKSPQDRRILRPIQD